MKKFLTAPWHAWEPPALPPHLTRRIIGVEVFILLALSLGKSGVVSLIRLIGYVTRPDASINSVSSQQINMSGLYDLDRPWYDFTLHAADFAFSLVPVMLAAWLLYNSRTSIREIWARGGKWIQASDFLRAGAMAAGVGIVGIGFYLICNALGFAATINVGDSGETVRYWVFLLTDSLETSILEECLVPGYFLVRLRQLGVGKGKALTSAAVLRGSYHLYQGLWGFVGNFFMGLIFGYLYMRWGRIAPLIIAHFLMDGVAFVGLALFAGQWGWIPTN